MQAIALRRFTRNGRPFRKGQRLTLTDGEFAELSIVKLVGRAPTKPKLPTRQ